MVNDHGQLSPVRRPGERRHQRESRFRRHVRFSFGPAQASLDAALDRLAMMIGAARRDPGRPAEPR
jgi:hypothetical protein